MLHERVPTHRSGITYGWRVTPLDSMITIVDHPLAQTEFDISRKDALQTISTSQYTSRPNKAASLTILHLSPREFLA